MPVSCAIPRGFLPTLHVASTSENNVGHERPKGTERGDFLRIVGRQDGRALGTRLGLDERPNPPFAIASWIGFSEWTRGQPGDLAAHRTEGFEFILLDDELKNFMGRSRNGRDSRGHPIDLSILEDVWGSGCIRDRTN